MNDIVTDLKLIQIDSVSLSESEVGKNINERFSNIDKNFQTIINSEYLKGQTGDGIYTKEYSFEKDSNEELGIYKGDQLLTSGKLYQLISECILTDVEYSGQPSNERILKGKIVLIYQNNGDKNILISSLPYVFIDKVYLDSLRTEDKPNPNRDLSCIVYFENNDFVKSSTIPKIYYDDNSAMFCWNINGEDTQLPAQGPKGADGKQGLSIYYAECKYTDSQYKLTRIFDPENGNFIDITSKVIENGNLILAYVTESDNTIVSINDIILGTYDSTTNIIKNNIKLNIPDISELMKNNPDNALYVNAGLNQNKNIYHSIYSVESDGSSYRDTLRIGLIEKDDKGLSRLDGAGELISDYQDNSFNNVNVSGKLTLSNSNKPEIQSNQNKIQITVGYQTSEEFTVPFATNSTNAEYAESAKLAESATTAKKIEDKPVLAANEDNKQIQITVGEKTSDAFIVPFAKYSGYSINPIVIPTEEPISLQPNKINYVWIADGESSKNIRLKIDLPVLDEESYVPIPESSNKAGICQCVLLVDANIQFEINWKYSGGNTQYSMDSSLLELSESGIKEIIFTGYWNKSDDQTNVIWIVGGDTYQLTTEN